jgi:hypothetical protein
MSLFFQQESQREFANTTTKSQTFPLSKEFKISKPEVKN